MKKILFIFLLFIICIDANSQAIYLPSRDGITINSPMASAQPQPLDARSMYHDTVNFLYRPYANATEALIWLQGNYRYGIFPIWICTGALQSNGTFIGGQTFEWAFRNGILDSNLVQLNIDGFSGAGFLLAANNLSDVANAATSRSNLGLGTIATQSATSTGSQISGTWPNGLVATQLNGYPATYYLNYNNLTNQPSIPPVTTITAGTNIAVGNPSPGNFIISAAATVSPTLSQVVFNGNTTDTSIFDYDSVYSLRSAIHGTLFVGDSAIYAPRSTQDTIYGYGNSIMAGTGASDGSPFFFQYCTYVNAYPLDSGVSGTLLTDFQSRLHLIPYWTPHHKIMLLYETNDYYASTPLSTYLSEYANVINSLETEKGYADTSIILLFCSLSGFTSGSLTPEGMEPWANSLDSLAYGSGVSHVDLYHYMVDNGNTSLIYLPATEHPNQAGHNVITDDMILSLNKGGGSFKRPIVATSIKNGEQLILDAPIVLVTGDRIRQSESDSLLGNTDYLTYSNGSNEVRPEIRGGRQSATITDSYVTAASNQGNNIQTGFAAYSHTDSTGLPLSDNDGFKIVINPSTNITTFSTFTGPETGTGGDFQIAPTTYFYADGGVNFGGTYFPVDDFLCSIPMHTYAGVFTHLLGAPGTDRLLSWNSSNAQTDTLNGYNSDTSAFLFQYEDGAPFFKHIYPSTIGANLQGVTTAGDSTGNRIITSNAIKVGDSTTYHRAYYQFGDSWTTGDFSTPDSNYLYAYFYNLVGEFGFAGGIGMYGIGGTEAQTPATNAADSAGALRTGEFPQYSNNSLIGIAYGLNDILYDNANGTSGYINNGILPMYNTAIAKGYPTNHIVLIAPGYTNSGSVESEIGPYITALQSFATAHGTLFLNVHDTMVATGNPNALLNQTGFHPNIAGNIVIQNAFYNLLVNNGFVPLDTAKRYLKTFGRALFTGIEADSAKISYKVTTQQDILTPPPFNPTNVNYGQRIHPNAITQSSDSLGKALFWLENDLSHWIEFRLDSIASKSASGTQILMPGLAGVFKLPLQANKGLTSGRLVTSTTIGTPSGWDGAALTDGGQWATNNFNGLTIGAGATSVNFTDFTNSNLSGQYVLGVGRNPSQTGYDTSQAVNIRWTNSVTQTGYMRPYTGYLFNGLNSLGMTIADESSTFLRFWQGNSVLSWNAGTVGGIYNKLWSIGADSLPRAQFEIYNNIYNATPNIFMVKRTLGDSSFYVDTSGLTHVENEIPNIDSAYLDGNSTHSWSNFYLKAPAITSGDAYSFLVKDYTAGKVVTIPVSSLPFAPTASPTFTGTVVLPTITLPGTSSQYVQGNGSLATFPATTNFAAGQNLTVTNSGGTVTYSATRLDTMEVLSTNATTTSTSSSPIFSFNMVTGHTYAVDCFLQVGNSSLTGGANFNVTATSGTATTGMTTFGETTGSTAFQDIQTTNGTSTGATFVTLSGVGMVHIQGTVVCTGTGASAVGFAANGTGTTTVYASGSYCRFTQIN